MTTKNDNEESEKKVKLAEYTAIKNMDKVQKKKRVNVWIKKSTLEYEEELRNLQTERIKVQNPVKTHGLRILILF